MVASIGDGYPFPTAMDRLVAGFGDVFAMKTEQELMQAALEAGQSRAQILDLIKKNQLARFGVFLDELHGFTPN